MNNRYLKQISTIFLLSMFLGLSVYCAAAATITVTSALDPDNTTGSCASSGSCSLRQAINASASGDTILFDLPQGSCPAGVCTVNLFLNGLTINKSLTIKGTGARNIIVRRADGTNPTSFTMFNVSSTTDITVNIEGITVTNGSTMGTVGGIDCEGPLHLNLTGLTVAGNVGTAGGILNNGGVVTILNSTISNNSGSFGGIANVLGFLIIANSTVSTNTGFGPGLGGGISNGITDNSAVTLDMNNVTIANNIQTGNDILSAGGIRNFGTSHLRNTIIAGNSSDVGTAQDARGIFLSQGSNFVGDISGTIGIGAFGSNDRVNTSPVIFALGNWGGQTNTHATTNLFPMASPAIDSGDNCVVTATCAINNPPVPLIYDQRGAPYVRNSGNTVDVGAFEFQPEPVVAAGTVGGRVFALSGGGLGNATVKITEANGQSHTALTNPSGYFRFENISQGQVVTLSINSKKFQYVPQMVNVTTSTPDTLFIP